jgi:hypothetical protein
MVDNALRMTLGWDSLPRSKLNATGTCGSVAVCATAEAVLTSPTDLPLRKY